jgi:zinc protease
MSLFTRRRFRWLGVMVGAIALALVLGWPAPANAVTARHYTDLTFPPLRDIQIPAYERYELSNGLVVYLMEDHELPLVSGTATFRTGERLAPANLIGLGSLTGDAMRLGGTETYSSEALNLALEQRAAAVETGIDDNSGSASFNALAEDLPEVFELFADVVKHPAFDPDQIDLLKNQYRGGIERRNDDPGDIASREFRKLVYGATSPYARTMEYATVNAISRDDLIAFYQASVRPDRTILGIVGDFDPDVMKARIEAGFANWQPPLSSLTLPTRPGQARPRLASF